MAVKTETLCIKVSPEEKERIKKEAEELDITVSRYLYRKIRNNGRENNLHKENS